jgi:hypothetical protein
VLGKRSSKHEGEIKMFSDEQKLVESGMVTHSYNPNAQEAEAGEWQVLGRLGSAE